MYEALIIISRSWRLHRPQRYTSNIRQQAPFADQPVCILRSLLLNALLDHDTEDIGDVLVQGAGLAAIDEWTRVLRDTVRHLMAYYVDAAGEIVEEVSAVSVNHLTDLAIPDCCLSVTKMP